MAGRYRRNGEAETLGCLVQLLLLLVAMPFVGLYLLIVFVKRKCEQKGPKKVSTFSTRFHVVSNVFPKYQMLTF